MVLLTTGEVADHLAVTDRTVRSLIKSGSLPAIRIGAEYRIDEGDLIQFIQKNRTTSAVDV